MRDEACVLFVFRSAYVRPRDDVFIIPPRLIFFLPGSNFLVVRPPNHIDNCLAGYRKLAESVPTTVGTGHFTSVQLMSNPIDTSTLVHVFVFQLKRHGSCG